MNPSLRSLAQLGQNISAPSRVHSNPSSVGDGTVVVPRLITVQEAARSLTVSTVTVRTWMREKKLVKVKLGRRVAVTAESVGRLINAGMA